MSTTSAQDATTSGPAGADRLPLSGLRVVEQGTFITGPFASMLLADMGADVIKVERPHTGDVFRSYDGTLYAPTFQSVNRNKRSVVVDMKDEEDRGLLTELIRSADVYIHNFRAGVAGRIGVGWADLHALNARLIYCSISGLGPDGPYAGRPAYDSVAQSFSGMLSLTLDPERPRIAGPATADAITGLYAAQGVLGALVQRGIDGAGHLVEVSMLEAMTHFLAEPFATYFGGGIVPGPYTRTAVSQSFAVRCSDGHLLALHLSSPAKFWLGLLDAIGLLQLADLPDFIDHAARVRNHEALRLRLQAAFETRPRDYWLSRLADRDVPHAPVLNLAEAASDQQFEHLQLAIEAQHPTQGIVRAIRPAHRFDGELQTEMQPPPTLGEHTAEIRAELRSAATRAHSF